MGSEPGIRTQSRLAPGVCVDGRYEVRQFIGRGGFASVYEAMHIHLDRRIALKILDLPSKGIDLDTFHDRFKQEARIAARMEHAGVVDVFDFGFTSDEQPYIAMELLDGHDLEQELVANGAIDPRRAKRLFVGVLEALQEAHQAGIVHKDLKPSNLFLSSPGTDGERLKILDFGIARVFTAPDERMTQTGGFTGTVAYLAPEYIQYQTVTPALDVYQMGLILAEAVTGKLAVESEGGSMGLLVKHCQGELEFDPALIDSPLGPAIRKATALSPDERYSDAGEFREALIRVDASTVPDWSGTFVARRDPGDSQQSVDAFGQTLGTPTNEHVTAPGYALGAQAASHQSSPASGPQSQQLQETAHGADTASVADGSKKALVVLASVLGLLVLVGGAMVAFLLAENRNVDGAESEELVAATEDDRGKRGLDDEPAPEPRAGAKVGAAVAPETSPGADEGAVDSDDAEKVNADAEEPAEDGDGAADDEPKEPAVSTVRVDTNPGGAAVVRDGEKLGIAPVELELEKGETVDLEFRKRGYHRDTKTVRADDGEVTFRLRKIRRKKPVPKAKPKPKPRPKPDPKPAEEEPAPLLIGN